MQLEIKVWKKSTLTALNLGNILNIKDDTNSVLWEENITSFLFIKGYSKFTNKRRHWISGKARVKLTHIVGPT